MTEYRPTIDDFYELKDSNSTQFKIIRVSPVKYHVYEEYCIDQITTYIIQGPDNLFWRIIFTYNSWGDDKIDIVGPVNEFQVINYEYLTEVEYSNIEKQGRIIKW